MRLRGSKTHLACIMGVARREIMMAAMNRPPVTATQIGHHSGPFPGLRLINGVMNATDDELRESVESCERAALWGGIAVVAGLVIKVVLAFNHAPFDSFEGIWGAVIADSMVALGVAAEILCSRLGFSRQYELQRRSDEKIAEANTIAAQATKDAADARERTALLEKLTAFRRLSEGNRKAIADAVLPIVTRLDVLIEWQNGDTEALRMHTISPWHSRRQASRASGLKYLAQSRFRLSGYGC